MFVKMWRAAGILVFAALLIWGSFSYRNVNQMFPRTTYREFQVGEVFEYEGYSFCVDDAELLRYSNFVRKYGDPSAYGVGTYAEVYDTHILLLTVLVENLSDTDQPLPPVYYFTLAAQKGGFSTNCDMQLMLHLYQDDLSFLDSYLHPHDTGKVVLPFSIDANMLPFYNNGVELQEFSFVYTLYPVKNYVTLAESDSDY